MIETTSERLLEEIHAAERWRDAHLESTASRIKRYVGPAFVKGNYADYDPENHAFEYLSLMVPKLVFSNPRVKVSSKKAGSKDEAMALQLGCNRWIQDVNLKRTLEKLAVDTLMNWGVAIVSLTPRPGVFEPEDPAMIPAVTRISPRRYLCDPLALSPEEFRWQGHQIVMDKASLLAWAKEHPDEGWDLEVIEAMSTDSAESKRLRKDAEDVPERQDLCFYEIWIPEHRDEKDEKHTPELGFHGSIFTVPASNGATSSKAKGYLRKPRPYFGPRWGPYTLFGIYTVPDNPLPLSPLTAVDPLVTELNDQVRAANDSAKRYKRLIFVDNTDAEIAQKIKQGGHDFVIAIDGFDKAKFAPAEVAGTTDQQAAQIVMMRDRLDRNAGMDDAVRGNVTGEGTATEVAVASESSATRTGYAAQRFSDGVQRLLKTVCHYLATVPEVQFQLGSEASEQLGMEEPVFTGGPTGDEEPTSLDSLDLEIEPYSMERTSEAVQLRRTEQMLTFLTVVAPIMPLTPWIDWKAATERYGEAINEPELAAIVDIETMLQVAALQLQAQQQAAQPEPAQKPTSAPAASGAGPERQGSSGPKSQPGSLPGRSSGSKAGSATKSKAKAKVA